MREILSRPLCVSETPGRTYFNCTDDVPPFLNAEIESALNKMKKYKAPDLDYITSDTIKVAGHDTMRNITALFNNILKCRRIPKVWKEGKIIILQKRRQKRYKELSPNKSMHLYELFTKVLQQRLEAVLDWNQPREQAGFSTADHLHTVSQLIEKCND